MTEQDNTRGQELMELYVDNNEREMKEKIKGLSFDDICLLLSHLYELIKKDDKKEKQKKFELKYKIKVIGELFIEKLYGETGFWYIEDKTTNMPYITKDGAVYIFTKEEYTKYYPLVSPYFEGHRKLMIQEAEQSVALGTISDFIFLNGVKLFIINRKHFPFEITSEDIIEYFKEIPPYRMRNPAFSSILLRYTQELRCDEQYYKRGDYMTQLANEFFTELCKAQFLVPVKWLSEAPSDENDVVLKQGTKFSIPIVRSLDRDERVDCTPVFTDWSELAKFYSPDSYDAFVWSFNDLANAPDNIVFNCGSVNFVVAKDTIKQYAEYNKKKETLLQEYNENNMDEKLSDMTLEDTLELFIAARTLLAELKERCQNMSDGICITLGACIPKENPAKESLKADIKFVDDLCTELSFRAACLTLFYPILILVKEGKSVLVDDTHSLLLFTSVDECKTYMYQNPEFLGKYSPFEIYGDKTAEFLSDFINDEKLNIETITLNKTMCPIFWRAEVIDSLIKKLKQNSEK